MGELGSCADRLLRETESGSIDVNMPGSDKVQVSVFDCEILSIFATFYVQYNASGATTGVPVVGLCGRTGQAP